MSMERWFSEGRWVVEECPEQPEEPMPLFQCDLPENAAQVASVHNALLAELERVNREWKAARDRDVKIAVARAERAEAQVRAVEAQRAEWERNGDVGQCVLADVDSALAAGLSLQEEQE